MNFKTFKVLSTEQRIKRWSEMRNSIKDLPILKQLKTVSAWWDIFELCNWTIDPDCTKNWITPYEMLEENVYCKNSIALGIFYTLHFGTTLELKLAMIKDDDNQYYYVVIVENEYVVNYSTTPIKLENLNAKVLYYRTFDKEFSDKKYKYNKDYLHENFKTKRVA